MKNNFFLILSIFVIIIAGCSKDEPECTDFTNPLCSNYNPCYNQEATSADFQTACVVVSNANRTITSVEDTFYLGSSIAFTALQEGALSYEWKIGDDARTFTERKFSLSFSTSDSVSLYNRPVPIQLIVTRTPNTGCFPTDDGIDTLTKYIYFVSNHEVEHKNYLGTWVGNLEAKPNEIYEIEIHEEIDPRSQPWESSYYYLSLKNLDNEGDGTCIFENYAGLFYNNFYISDFVTPNYIACQRINIGSPVNLYGNIDKKGNMRLSWTQWISADNKSEQRVFTGRRK